MRSFPGSVQPFKVELMVNYWYINMKNSYNGRFDILIISISEILNINIIDMQFTLICPPLLGPLHENCKKVEDLQHFTIQFVNIQRNFLNTIECLHIHLMNFYAWFIFPSRQHENKNKSMKCTFVLSITFLTCSYLISKLSKTCQ